MRRLLLLGLLSTGCEEEPAPSPAAGLDAEPPASFSAPRRPERRVYLANEGGACVVYWESDDVRSETKKVLCPRAIEPDERLRLSGRTCHRESPVPDRRGPVRCAQAMLYVKEAWEGGDEPGYDLPPKRD